MKCKPETLPIDKRRTFLFSANLALAMAASTLLLFAIGVLAPILTVELGIARNQVGLLATLFLATGAVFSPIIGSRAGSLGSRWGFIVLYVYAMVSYMVVAFSPNFAWMLMAVAVAGVTGSVSNPLTNHVIYEHASVGQRGVMLGIKQSGVQVGTFLAGAVLPSLAVAVGWRFALLVAGLIPMMGICLTVAVVPGVGGRFAGEAARPPRGLVRFAVEHPFLIWVGVYGVFMGAGMSASGVYLPLYSFESLGFSAQAAGLVGAVVGVVGIPGRILWGRAVERRTERVSFDLKWVAIGSVCAVGMVLGAIQVGGWLVWVGAGMLGGITQAWNVIAMMAAIRDLPAGAAGAGTGIIQLGFYVGMLAGPVGFGAVLGSTGRYALAWTLVFGVFLSAAAVVQVWRWSTRAAS